MVGFGFAIVLIGICILFYIDLKLQAIRTMQEERPFELGVWLRKQSEALPPGSTHWECLSEMVIYRVCCFRDADWFRSSIFVITHFTSHFSHFPLSHLAINLAFLILVLPCLRKVMSSRKIVISSTLGGFLPSNLVCAIKRFRNPNTRLTPEKLDLKSDRIT